MITKVEGSGGAVTAGDLQGAVALRGARSRRAICQPDVIADFSGVDGAPESARPGAPSSARRARRDRTLKVSIGYRDSYIGEGQISYAGPGALARGRLALEIVGERLALTGVQTTRAALRPDRGRTRSTARTCRGGGQPYEVRVRVAGRTDRLRRSAMRIGNEVETLYTNGPAGGGGAWKSAREVVAVASTLIPEADVRTAVQYFEA